MANESVERPRIEEGVFVRRNDLEPYFAAIKQHPIVGLKENDDRPDPELYRPETIQYYANRGFYPICFDAIHKKMVLLVREDFDFSTTGALAPEKDLEGTIYQEQFVICFLDGMNYIEPDFFNVLLPQKLAHVIDSSNLEIKIVKPQIFSEILPYVKDSRKIKQYERQKRMADSKDKGLISNEDNETVAGEWLERILTYAVLHRATDVHFEWTGESYIARIRIDGDLRLYPTNEDPIEIPSAYYAPMINVIRLKADLDITEHFVPQDGQMHFDCHFLEEGKVSSSYDMRVSIIPEVEGRLNVVLRIQQKGEFKKLYELGFSEVVYKDVKTLTEEPHGLVLVTGPTGSGKTTTLYSMLNELNTTDKKILTAEDPVEIHMNNITQVNINPKQKRTFPTMLRSFLRHDPDVILVGEIRDEETAKLAINAANTGHLVLSTLHTNDAPSSIKRLGNMEGVDPADFAFALKGILAQRLIKVFNPEIRAGLSSKDPEIVAKTINNWELVSVDAGILLNEIFGENIFESGQFYTFDNQDKEGVFQGRTAITEFWKLGRQAQDMIFDQKFSTKMLWDCAIENDHMLPMAYTGFAKVINCSTSIHNLIHIVGIDAIRSSKKLILDGFFN